MVPQTPNDTTDVSSCLLVEHGFDEGIVRLSKQQNETSSALAYSSEQGVTDAIPNRYG